MQQNYVTKKNYTIYIDKLLDDDLYATISSLPTAANDMADGDVGHWINWSSFKLSNSLISPADSKSTITLITSNHFNQLRDSDSEESVINDVSVFLSTLEGRRVTVSVDFTYIQNTDNEVFIQNVSADTKIVYVGYIISSPESVTPSGGAMFTIECLPLIAQLNKLSPNVAWEDTTETYGGAATSIVKNSWSKEVFEMLIYRGTLFNDTDKLIYEDSEDYPALPDNGLWAFIVPTSNRYDIINEVICVYSLVFYQSSNGELHITPLFYDDRVDECYNIDVSRNNTTNNYMDFRAVNNSISTPNRIDVTLVDLPGSPFGITKDDNFKKVIASAPYVQQDDSYGEIVDLPNQKLKYTEIYTTNTRLYNSGKFIQPEIHTISLDNMLTSQGNNIVNVIMQRAKLSNSSVNSSTATDQNAWAQLYAQLFLAEINVSAYTAVVSYDYDQVILGDDPLGKIVTITGSNKLDYPDNIIIDTTLIVSADTGSIFVVKTAPLLSITPCWYSKNGDTQNV